MTPDRRSAVWRGQLSQLLAWRDAHADFDAAVLGWPPRLRGVVPEGWEHSAWQIIEHIRIAQADILEFCVGRTYVEKAWPEAYWPKSPQPPNAAAWTKTITTYRRERRALQRVARNADVDLTAPVPRGTGQTYLREILLVADHTAYHVGQLVALRRLLGAWK
jgi:uncharacterized damage-inducible protein DinB